MSFAKAIKMPFQDAKKFLLGWLFGMFPILNLFVYGYAIECSRNTMKKRFQLPDWKNFGDLFIRGLLYSIIIFIYYLPTLILSLILLFPLIGTAFETIVNLQEASVEAITNTIITTIVEQSPINFLIVFVLFILTAYLMLAGIIHYSKNLRFKEAFNISEIFKFAFSQEYFVASIFIGLYSFFVSLIIQLITISLSALPFFLVIADGFLIFVLSVTQLSFFGSVYSDYTTKRGKKAETTKKQTTVNKRKSENKIKK